MGLHAVLLRDREPGLDLIFGELAIALAVALEKRPSELEVRSRRGQVGVHPPVALDGPLEVLDRLVETPGAARAEAEIERDSIRAHRRR